MRLEFFGRQKAPSYCLAHHGFPFLRRFILNQWLTPLRIGFTTYTHSEPIRSDHQPVCGSNYCGNARAHVWDVFNRRTGDATDQLSDCIWQS